MDSNDLVLSHDDRVRMERLYEEIQSRLQEMALIGVRYASASDPEFAKQVKSNPGELQFKPHQAPADAKQKMKGKVQMKGTSIVCYGSGPNMCLCYNYDIGICRLC